MSKAHPHDYEPAKVEAPVAPMPSATPPAAPPLSAVAAADAERKKWEADRRAVSQIDYGGPIQAPAARRATDPEAEERMREDIEAAEKRAEEAGESKEAVKAAGKRAKDAGKFSVVFLNGTGPDNTFTGGKTKKELAVEVRARKNTLYEVHLSSRTPIGRNPLYVEAKDEADAKAQYLEAKQIEQGDGVFTLTVIG